MVAVPIVAGVAMVGVVRRVMVVAIPMVIVRIFTVYTDRDARWRCWRNDATGCYQ
jgi:hypothetical protein